MTFRNSEYRQNAVLCFNEETKEEDGRCTQVIITEKNLNLELKNEKSHWLLLFLLFFFFKITPSH